ncbi:MAG: hypothetical protein KGN36_12335 [Acidobacteriota bacterium]|nr:hypothetical protein [Acidobacteriota bacterium]
MSDLSVLVASPRGGGLKWFEVVLGGGGWQFSCAGSMEEAAGFIRAQGNIVLVAEPEWTRGDWQPLLARLIEAGRPSAMVVVNHAADERLWGQVLELGSYGGLRMPFSREDVARTLAAAWRHCKAGGGGKITPGAPRGRAA